jgi:hypothetical protein
MKSVRSGSSYIAFCRWTSSWFSTIRSVIKEHLSVPCRSASGLAIDLCVFCCCYYCIISVTVASFFFFFLVVLRIELRASGLSHSSSHFLCWVFSRWGLVNYLLRLTSSLDSPGLCLQGVSHQSPATCSFVVSLDVSGRQCSDSVAWDIFASLSRLITLRLSVNTPE